MFEEFWWLALALCLTAWRYCKSSDKLAVAILPAATELLYFISGSSAFYVVRFGKPAI